MGWQPDGSGGRPRLRFHESACGDGCTGFGGRRRRSCLCGWLLNLGSGRFGFGCGACSGAGGGRGGLYRSTGCKLGSNGFCRLLRSSRLGVRFGGAWRFGSRWSFGGRWRFGRNWSFGGCWGLGRSWGFGRRRGGLADSGRFGGRGSGGLRGRRCFGKRRLGQRAACGTGSAGGARRRLCGRDGGGLP